MISLEKILQSQGFGSRKECRGLIEQGRVMISDQVIDDPQAKFRLEQLPVSVELATGIIHWQCAKNIYLAMHKPADYECSHKPSFHPSIYGLLPYFLINRDVQSVGRLDQDTTGLLLFSDDGQFIHRLSSGKKEVEKVYQIDLAEPIADAAIAQLLAGIFLEDEPQPVQAKRVHRLGPQRVEMTITEGKYHQVKRMIGALGNAVSSLHRSRVGNFDLPVDLAVGQYRLLDQSALAFLV